MVRQKQTATLLNFISSFPNNAAAIAPLQFLALGTTPGVTRFVLPQIDDGFSSAINITEGFLFGFNAKTVVYVSIQTN